MASAPGRNDPCPCGSAKKFKHCCLATHDAADAARLRLRAAEGRILEPLFKFAVQRWGQALFHHAWEDFWNYGDVPEDMAGAPEFDPMFVPWFTLGFVPDAESDDALPDWPTRPIGLEWLARHGTIVPALDRLYVETACRSPLSVFAVEQVVRGRSVDIKDILTGVRFHVLEQRASQSLQVADVIFSRVLTIEGTSILLGMGPFVAPPSWHVQILDWREHYFRKRLAMRHDLGAYDGEIRDLYFEVADFVQHPPLPVLTNTDGDLMVPTTLTYALQAPVSDAYERLLPLATLDGEVHESQVTRDAAGAVTAAELVWITAGNKKMKTWDNTILGALTIEPERLVAKVNSVKRAAKLRKEIAKRLGPLAVLTSTTTSDPFEALEARSRSRVRTGLTRHQPEPELHAALDSDERSALQAELEEHHWASWLTTPVPALQNKTPRQAARSAGGRERLEALLADLERRSGPGRAAGVDRVAALRAALKLRKPGS